jgi:hypothetical protein
MPESFVFSSQPWEGLAAALTAAGALSSGCTCEESTAITASKTAVRPAAKIPPTMRTFKLLSFMLRS